MGFLTKTIQSEFVSEQTEFVLKWDDDSIMKLWSSAKENLVEGMTIYSSFCYFIPEHVVKRGHVHKFKLVSSASSFCGRSVGLVTKTPGRRDYDPIGEYDLHDLNHRESIGSTETHFCYECETKKYQVSTLARRKELLVTSYDQLMDEVGISDRSALAMMDLIDASYDLEPDATSGVYTISSDGSSISNSEGSSTSINWTESQ